MHFAMSPSASAVVLTCLVVVVLVVEAAVVPPPETKIVGGHEIEIADAPWQVALLLDGYHNCGGSILNPRWVLTAGHCLMGYSTSRLQIRIGSKLAKEGGKLYDVFQAIVHGGFETDDYLHDVGLMKTKTPMDLIPPVQAVKLPGLGDKRPAPGTSLTVTGWGQTENSDGSDSLLSVDVKLLDFDFKDCAEFVGSKEETTICAGLPGKGSCHGDSGGPLVTGDLLVGVVSYGPDNTTCGAKVAFYMDVAYYREWIDLYMNEECQCGCNYA